MPISPVAAGEREPLALASGEGVLLLQAELAGRAAASQGAPHAAHAVAPGDLAATANGIFLLLAAGGDRQVAEPHVVLPGPQTHFARFQRMLGVFVRWSCSGR